MVTKLKKDAEDIERIREDSYDNEYEMKSMLPQVKSSIKENVTSDYTLAILNKDEKEFITENYGNAEYAKEIIKRFADKGYKYEWDGVKKDWVRNSDGSCRKIYLSKEDKDRIYSMAERVFAFFMITPHMIAILNRNRDENFMVRLLGKAEDEPKKIEYDKDDKNVLQKIGDFFKGRNGGGDDEGYD